MLVRLQKEGPKRFKALFTSLEEDAVRLYPAKDEALRRMNMYTALRNLVSSGKVEVSDGCYAARENLALSLP